MIMCSCINYCHSKYSRPFSKYLAVALPSIGPDKIGLQFTHICM